MKLKINPKSKKKVKINLKRILKYKCPKFKRIKEYK